ncbi:MAG: hypothetical protein WC007_13325 [Pelobacteraceae bacterium]
MKITESDHAGKADFFLGIVREHEDLTRKMGVVNVEWFDKDTGKNAAAGSVK